MKEPRRAEDGGKAPQQEEKPSATGGDAGRGGAALCAQAVWDRGYEAEALEMAKADDPLRLWLEARLGGAEGGGGCCLELGCFPGRYLAVLGRLGYEVHGVDLTPRTDTELAPWLAGLGCRVGTIERGDFFSVPTVPPSPISPMHPIPLAPTPSIPPPPSPLLPAAPSPPSLEPCSIAYPPSSLRAGCGYDVVCSFGVIEHFADWRTFLERQASLVAPGGRLVVTAPNFRGWLQHGLHRALDRENLERHCLEAMRPDAWAAHLAAQGWEVLEWGGLGRFDFWAGEARRGPLGGAALWLVRSLRGAAARILPVDTLWCCPHVRLLARRLTPGARRGPFRAPPARADKEYSNPRGGSNADRGAGAGGR